MLAIPGRPQAEPGNQHVWLDKVVEGLDSGFALARAPE
jgi:hypothetical protein